jgi:predicted site-specific integrase-resolvase
MVSPEAVGLALRVSTTSVRRWCREGLLEHVRTPQGHLRIPQRALDALLHPETAGSPPADG